MKGAAKPESIVPSSFSGLEDHFVLTSPVKMYSNLCRFSVAEILHQSFLNLD